MSWLKSTIEFLNDNSGSITAVATIILTVITGLYVYFTGKLVRTSEETLRVSNTPKVQVSLTNHLRSEDIWTVDFCVQNIGTGFAYDIKFSGDFFDLYPQTSQEPLGENPIIKDGISHLGPGKRYQIPIIWKPLKLDLPQGTFNVSVTYGGSEGIRPTDKFCLDFTKYEGYTQIGDPSIDSIAMSLIRIEKTLREMEKKQNNPNQ